MRVTARTYYQDYAKTVGDLHGKLNEAMSQVSTGRKYNSASENPIAYYAGKRMDNQYADAEAKETVIKDVQNRLYQQEAGARSIQQHNMRSVNTQVLALRQDTKNVDTGTVKTYRTQFTQELRGLVNTLNSQYDNYYVYGGNDMSTVPFSLDVDLKEDLNQVNQSSISLTYHHRFPGEADASHIRISYSYNKDSGHYENHYSLVDENGNAIAGKSEDDALQKLVSAMREQGRMNTGYGSLRDRSTLIDTYTGGLNMLTGLSSDTLRNLSDEEAVKRIRGGKDGSGIEERVNAQEDSMLNSPVSLISKAILSAHNLVRSQENGTEAQLAASRKRFDTDLAAFIDQNDNAESRISDSYRELGVKSAALSHTKEQLSLTKDTLTAQYKDKLGIDTYDAIVKMYSYQYSYNAAMKVGSHIMQSSLFEFVK
ncbi:MAG: hypothetical protein ACTTHL_03880 [Oribacterium sp.]